MLAPPNNVKHIPIVGGTELPLSPPTHPRRLSAIRVPLTISTSSPSESYQNGWWRLEHEEELASPAPEESGEGVVGGEEIGK